MNKNPTTLKEEYRMYLQTLSLDDLRCYGRFLQLQSPTKLRKKELIETIILVLCGELTPKRNRRGAPIKNNHCDPKIHDTLKQISNGTLPALNKNQNEEFTYPKSVNLSITINPATLTEEQKKKLSAFILSL